MVIYFSQEDVPQMSGGGAGTFIEPPQASELLNGLAGLQVGLRSFVVLMLLKLFGLGL